MSSKRLRPTIPLNDFTALGARVIQDSARFIDKDTLFAGERESVPDILLLQLDLRQPSHRFPVLLTLITTPMKPFLICKKKPDHLMIIGAGPIGCEMAQAFHYLGVKVTVLEASP